MQKTLHVYLTVCNTVHGDIKLGICILTEYHSVGNDQQIVVQTPAIQMTLF